MKRRHPAVIGCAVLFSAAVALTGCSRGSEAKTASTDTQSSAASGCADVVATAKAAVDKAAGKDAAWDGPTSGPKAQEGKTVVYVAQSMQNPGVAGVAEGLQAASDTIGWTLKTIDGQGTPAGIQNAFNQALALKPDGIIIGGFDPNTTADQVNQANSANIPLVGWQALATPGPSESPKLFSNVTTKVEDVAKISADYIIAESNGNAGVVIFTDSSIPFAEGKSQMIQKELQTCSSIEVLKYDNIPLADVANRMPTETSALINSLGDKWTYSVAINDVYFENAAAAFRQAGLSSTSAPVNVGAGDGDAAALTRIRNGEFQNATVPSPLRSEGWQIIDELNRAMAGEAASGYVPQIHVSTKDNGTADNFWDPAGYQDAYKAIWGK
ncbi:substrate-binding domain-containing protein [Actinomyces culturomici]|uniref:substrate-binding domain-containing protein n=1 Tax=Actinomyces culturomici TaxID=1926276 RepID=UPI000E1FD528|nr:substrate-binding domain-containing protein [Actinomyces culturomici]